MSEPNEILAEKSAAEEASSVERCLTFESGGLTLFLSTNYVTEIINDCSITHLPLVPGQDVYKRQIIISSDGALSSNIRGNMYSSSPSIIRSEKSASPYSIRRFTTSL